MAESDFLSQLAELRRGFLAQLPDKVSLLEGAVMRWQEAPDGGMLEEAVETAHKLAGSGATFGVPAISDSARTLESALLRAGELKGPPDPAIRGAVGTALQALKGAAAEALAPPPA